MPEVRRALSHLLNPLDSTRYTELAHLFSFFDKRLKDLKVLDVSSPHMLSYLLSRDNDVIKTNIDEGERRFIRESPRLKFHRADALKLDFPDESFDLTCSVSVVEHIYAKYIAAVRELSRVTKKGGFLYLTFPVSEVRTEEWLTYPMYPAQEKTGKGFFFQYRFDKADVDALLAAAGPAEVVSRGVYWERREGAYDGLMAALRKDLHYAPLNLLRNSVLNLYSGFFLLENSPAGFGENRGFGNISVVLKKL